MNNLVQKLSNLCTASIEAKFVASFVTKKRHFVQIVVTGQFSKFFVDANYGAGKKLHCDRMHTKVFCFKNFCCHFFRALSKNHASVDKVKNLSCGSKPVLMQWV